MIYCKRLLQFIRSKLSWFINLCLVTGSVLLGFYLLEYSTCALWKPVLQQIREYSPEILALNLLTLFVVWSILFVISDRVWISTLCFSVLTGGIAIANYFVITLHGMPLSFLLLRNFATAMDVISGYQLSIDRYVLKMLYITGFLIVSGAAAGFLTRKYKLSLKKRLAGKAILAGICALIVYFGYFGEDPVKPPNKLSFLWRDAYHEYGYTACSVETLYLFFHTVNEPDGYSEDAVQKIQIPASTGTRNRTPDVILILNESFCDLSQLADLKTDKPVLEKIHSLDNVLTGYAVTPMNSGGTNCSEYELLTSNSLQLMPGVTPFNMLDLRGANSIASFLNQAGYHTLAAHCKTHENYNRKTGYSMLGFQSYFFEDDFENLEGYGERKNATDASVYENVIRWYETAQGDQPRFQFILTYQNHADYDRNDPEYDTVHALNDYGEYDSQVDEFLTVVDLSDQAFADLAAYFSEVDRDVVICMVGDHTPSILGHLLDASLDSEQLNLMGRTVPLIIWANFELEKQELGTMSMNYVVPTLLDISGMKLSPYYRYQIHLKQQVPIVTSYGRYFDRNGNLFKYETDAGQQWETMVDSYLHLEYHNLHSSEDRWLFMPES